MQKVFILVLVVGIFSCKKETQTNNSFHLSETNWNLHFKNNPTFSFYAESELSFAADSSVKNYRNDDTISGRWRTKNNAITINFDNGDVYSGNAITSDSISGTLIASGSSGDWYAIKR